MNTPLQLEGQVFPLKGQGNGHQDGGVSDADKVRAQIEGQQIEANPGLDQRLEVFESHCGRTLHTGIQHEALHEVMTRHVATNYFARARSAQRIFRARQGARVGKDLLFSRVEHQLVIPVTVAIEEFNVDFGAKAFDVPIAPALEGINDRHQPGVAFRGGWGVTRAGAVGFDLIRWPVDDVDAAAVAPPAGPADTETLVGVSNAAVVFFLELVFDRVRGGVAA